MINITEPPKQFFVTETGNKVIASKFEDGQVLSVPDSATLLWFDTEAEAVQKAREIDPTYKTIKERQREAQMSARERYEEELRRLSELEG